MIRKQKERAEVTENTSNTVVIEESDSSKNVVLMSSSNLGNYSLSHHNVLGKRDLSMYSRKQIAYQNKIELLMKIRSTTLTRSIQLLERAKSSLPTIFVFLSIGTNSECISQISLVSLYVFLHACIFLCK